MNGKQWTEEELNYIKDNYGKIPIKEISLKLNRSISSIKHKAERDAIKSPREWTDEEIGYLKENYKTKTYKELSQHLNRTKSAIDLKINRLGLKKEKYTYNHHYFENIDTEDKAYWLGFIYADGCVMEYENNSCELAIKLQARDIGHLKKFNKSINGNNQITTFNRQCNLNGKFYDGCQIRLYSEKIVHDLERHGVYPNKSLVITMPDINDDMFRHFIRGYFDGDGCIYQSGNVKNSYVQCNFSCGSVVFLEQLRSYLYGNNINSYICHDHDNVWKLIIGGMKNCDLFLHYIYDDANIYLDRKYLRKEELYKHLDIEQRLLRQSEKTGFINLSEKENGNPETEIRVEGCV